MNIQPEGSVSFWLNPEHGDWPTNSSGYEFPRCASSGIALRAVKHPDRILQIDIEGLAQPLTFSTQIPVCDERGLFVVVTWTIQKACLYLNTQLVQTKDL